MEDVAADPVKLIAYELHTRSLCKRAGDVLVAKVIHRGCYLVRRSGLCPGHPGELPSVQQGMRPTVLSKDRRDLVDIPCRAAGRDRKYAADW
jgi:hypothetical protein